MSRLRSYYVTALDTDDCVIGQYESGSNRAIATQEARGSLHDDKEWRAAGMVRVTVTDDNGTVWEDLRQ